MKLRDKIKNSNSIELIFSFTPLEYFCILYFLLWVQVSASLWGQRSRLVTPLPAYSAQRAARLITDAKNSIICLS